MKGQPVRVAVGWASVGPRRRARPGGRQRHGRGQGQPQQQRHAGRGSLPPCGRALAAARAGGWAAAARLLAAAAGRGRAAGITATAGRRLLCARRLREAKHEASTAHISSTLRSTHQHLEAATAGRERAPPCWMIAPASTLMPPHPCRSPGLSECICRGRFSSPVPAKHGQRRATQHNAREAERMMREHHRAMGAQESWRGGGLAAERARSAAGSARARSGGRGEPRAYRSDGVAALGRPGAWPDAGGGLGLSALSSAAACESGGG